MQFTFICFILHQLDAIKTWFVLEFKKPFQSEFLVLIQVLMHLSSLTLRQVFEDSGRHYSPSPSWHADMRLYFFSKFHDHLKPQTIIQVEFSVYIRASKERNLIFRRSIMFRWQSSWKLPAQETETGRQTSQPTSIRTPFMNWSMTTSSIKLFSLMAGNGTFRYWNTDDPAFIICPFHNLLLPQASQYQNKVSYEYPENHFYIIFHTDHPDRHIKICTYVSVFKENFLILNVLPSPKRTWSELYIFWVHYRCLITY